MQGNNPSGSAPESVYLSVWQIPVALISTSTSPSFGPSRSTVSTDRGFPASQATAARTCIAVSPSGSVLVNHRGSGGPRQRVFAYENEPAAECGRRLCKQNGLERIQ